MGFNRDCQKETIQTFITTSLLLPLIPMNAIIPQQDTTDPKHSPGPWVVCQNSGPMFIAQMTDRKGRIATVRDDETDQRIACANAMLIAAAPAMLQALEFVAKYEKHFLIGKGKPGFPEQLHSQIALAIMAATPKFHGPKS